MRRQSRGWVHSWRRNGLFNAKKDAADGGGPQLDRLAAEVDERLSLAALRRSG